MPSYDDIYLFIQVVKLNGFSKVAKLFHLSHTTISRRMKCLEELLDVILFIRSPQHFQLTEAGRQFYDLVEAYMGNLDELSTSIASNILKKNLAHGTINISMPPGFALYLITPLLPLFVREHPEINLNVVYTNEPGSLLKNGIDFAIVAELPTQQSQKFKKVFKAQYGIFCTNQYKERFGIPTTLQELCNHNIVGWVSDDFQVMKKYIFINTITGETETINLSPQIATNNAIQAHQMIFTNEIISFTHDGLLTKRNEIQNDIIRVLPEYRVKTTDFYLLKNPFSKGETQKIFEEFISKVLAQK